MKPAPGLPHRARSKAVVFYPLVFVTLVGLACSLSNPTPVMWSATLTSQAQSSESTAFASTQAANYQPLPTYTSTPTFVAPTPTPPSGELNQNGPWMLYPSHAGQALIALNPDGSGATTITIPPLLDVTDLTQGLSPQGGVIAFRTGLRATPEDSSLYLLYLPSGRLQLLTALLSPDEQALAAGGQNPRASEAAQGVIQRDALAWSPDGRYLAFIAAIERNATDLYVYDTQTEKITRMTFGANMYATPYWSPTGRWIYVQEVISYNNDKGWTPGAVWSVDAQTDLTYQVYSSPATSAGEVFLGWANDASFLTYSLDANGGNTLRTIDTTHGKVTVLYKDAFSQVAFDPIGKMIAFTISGHASGSGTQGDGLYTLASGSSQPKLIEAGDWQGLRWSADGGAFLASGAQGSLVVNPDGAETLVANEANAMPSPDGNWLAGWGDGSSGGQVGLRLYRAGAEILQEVTTDPVQGLAWQPDSKGFFFISGNHLDLATFPSLQPRTLDADIRPGKAPGLVWIP